MIYETDDYRIAHGDVESRVLSLLDKRQFYEAGKEIRAYENSELGSSNMTKGLWKRLKRCQLK